MGLLADSPIPSGFTGTRLGVCNLCEAICGLRVTFTDGEVTGIRGNPEDPLSRGHVCPKGVSLADVHADPDRLRRPVRRVGTGEDARWEEMEWEEALDLVADRLAATSREHGRDAVGVGRVRQPEQRSDQLDFWLSGDQLLKGAALNAVQIAERLQP